MNSGGCVDAWISYVQFFFFQSKESGEVPRDWAQFFFLSGRVATGHACCRKPDVGRCRLNAVGEELYKNGSKESRAGGWARVDSLMADIIKAEFCHSHSHGCLTRARSRILYAPPRLLFTTQTCLDSSLCIFSGGMIWERTGGLGLSKHTDLQLSLSRLWMFERPLAEG